MEKYLKTEDQDKGHLTARPDSAPTVSEAQQPVVGMKDHQIAQTVNALTSIARDYRDTEQLRERISHVIAPILKGEGFPKSIVNAYAMPVAPGSASSEAAGDARTAKVTQALAELAKAGATVLEDLNARIDAADGPVPVFRGIAALHSALVFARAALPATQASTDRALFISGAAGPLGDPEILGSPTDSQMLDWLEEKGFWKASSYIERGFNGNTLREAIRAAMSANTTKETE